MKWISAIIIAVASFLFIINHFGSFSGNPGRPEKKSTAQRALSMNRETQLDELRLLLANSEQGRAGSQAEPSSN